MATEKVYIGGRRSKLAVVQSEHVRDIIQEAHPHIECPVLALQTLGDQVQSRPLYSFGGKALWTKELEDLLYAEDESRLDLIVHSLKDMPTVLPDQFELGSITKRVDPSDAIVMASYVPYKTLGELPHGAIVGTSSVRRSAQLKKNYPHLQFESVRGNIHTRLNKLDSEETPYVCLVLASAGLIRVGLDARITTRLTSKDMYHAVGQGALGIEIRKGDDKIKAVLAKIEDKEATVCCLAERALLRTLEGGCSVPIGVESNYDGSKLSLKGIVVDVEGIKYVEDEVTKDIGVAYKEDAEAVGIFLAHKLIEKGAKQILDEINFEKLK